MAEVTLTPKQRRSPRRAICLSIGAAPAADAARGPAAAVRSRANSAQFKINVLREGFL
jgi:hypothetical protein